MSKINLNDHYFVAWINVTYDKNYYINDGKIYVEMTPSEYGAYLEEYKETYKPVLAKIRKVVKELNGLTSKTKTVK